MRYLGLLLAFLFLLAPAPAQTTLLVAHRGGPVEGPENRLSTFEQAAALGVGAIELDIHQSKDHQLVVIHDITLKRTFGVEGRVDEMSLSELQALGVPALQEVFDQVGDRCRLVVEIKHPPQGYHQGIEARLVELLKQNRRLGDTIVISFHQDSLERLHELEPQLETGLLYGGDLPEVYQLAQRLGVTYLSPHYGLVTDDYIELAHQSGFRVNAWTVNDPVAMKRLIKLGCDAITTDDPRQLARILGEP